MSDIYYTPDWVAKDMISYFRPNGYILEPCIGKGAIYKYLLDADWCEIEKGRDFFEWSKSVDWIFTNPPYSKLTKFFEHSMYLAENIVFLIPMNFYFMKGRLVYKSFEWGYPKSIRIYGLGAKLKFPMGNPIAAFHWEKGYRESTKWSFYEN